MNNKRKEAMKKARAKEAIKGSAKGRNVSGARHIPEAPYG